MFYSQSTIMVISGWELKTEIYIMFVIKFKDVLSTETEKSKTKKTKEMCVINSPVFP